MKQVSFVPTTLRCDRIGKAKTTDLDTSCARDTHSIHKEISMYTIRFTLRILTLITFACAFAAVAQAQATRTWVSGVGDDANPCSRTAPCKTFAGAISKTADGGEIDCVDPGGFGAVTITKGITIDGGGTFASILFAGTNGIIVNDATNTKTIILRNLSLNGAGTGLNGIRLLAGKTFVIENVAISGFTTNGIDAPLVANGSKVFINDVDIRNGVGASSIGVKLATSTGVLTGSMDHLRVDRLPTAVQIGTNSFPTIRNSVLFGGTKGVEILASTSRVTIENTVLSENGTGLSVGAGATALLSQSTITECSTGISNSGTVSSSGNNRILGNSSDGATPGIINPK